MPCHSDIVTKKSFHDCMILFNTIMKSCQRLF